MTLGAAGDVSWAWVAVLAVLPVAASLLTSLVNHRAELQRQDREDRRTWADDRRTAYVDFLAATSVADRGLFSRTAQLNQYRMSDDPDRVLDTTGYARTVPDRIRLEEALGAVMLWGGLGVVTSAKAIDDLVFGWSANLLVAETLVGHSGTPGPYQRPPDLDDAIAAFRSAARAELGVDDTRTPGLS